MLTGFSKLGLWGWALGKILGKSTVRNRAVKQIPSWCFTFCVRLVGFCTVVSSFLFFLHLMLKLLFLFFSSGCLHITFFWTFSVSSVSITYCSEAKQPQAPKIGRIQWDSYFATHGVSLSDSLKLCWCGLTRAVQGWKGLRMPQSVSASWYSSTWPLFRV